MVRVKCCQRQCVTEQSCWAEDVGSVANFWLDHTQVCMKALLYSLSQERIASKEIRLFGSQCFQQNQTSRDIFLYAVLISLHNSLPSPHMIHVNRVGIGRTHTLFQSRAWGQTVGALSRCQLCEYTYSVCVCVSAVDLAVCHYPVTFSRTVPLTSPLSCRPLSTPSYLPRPPSLTVFLLHVIVSS